MLRVGIANNPQVTGVCCDVGWYLEVGSPEEPIFIKFLNIFFEQMVTTGGLVLATTYPSDTQFEVEYCVGTNSCSKVRRAQNKAELLTGNQRGYLWNKGSGAYANLFLNIVDEENDYYSAGDTRILLNGGSFANKRIIVKATNKGNGGKIERRIPDADWLKV